MNMRNLASMPFAHLLGFGHPAATEDGDAPQGPPRTTPGAHLAGPPKADEKAKDKPEAEDDKPKDDKAKGGEDDKPKDDKAKDGEGDKPKGEEPAPEDEDAEAQGNGTAAQARGRERARIAAILNSPNAANNVAFAAQIATGTTLPRAQAIALLATAPAAAAPPPRRQALDDRMRGLSEAENPTPGLGGAPAPEGVDALVASMLAAAGRSRAA